MLSNSNGNQFILPSNSSKMLYHDALCDVKIAKKARIEPVQRQRIDRTFEFQVQAISVDKLLCILNAVVNSTITPTTDDHDHDDNLSHHLNDLVKGVIERETRALAASMTMAEIFRRTSSTSINHQPVAVFGNVQLELKHLGRLILYDAYIYVKPQFVGVSERSPNKYMAEEEERERRQDATRTRQTEEKVFLNVQADQLREAAAFPSQVSDILLPGHVLRLLRLLPVVLDREIYVYARPPELERRQVIRPRGLFLHDIPADINLPAFPRLAFLAAAVVPEVRRVECIGYPLCILLLL
jgi:hypothetical protein